jgi:hypothetical protein
MPQPTSYAVCWIERDARYVGYLRLGPLTLELDGSGNGVEAIRSVRYRDITGVDVSRTSGEERSIVVELPRERLRISSLDRPGALGEVADRLRELTDLPDR